MLTVMGWSSEGRKKCLFNPYSSKGRVFTNVRLRDLPVSTSLHKTNNGQNICFNFRR